ncbi:hypothetical protein J1614_006489, partial [Plenodomus biglobosus]
PLPQTWSAPLTDGSYPDPEPCHGNCTSVLDPSVFYNDGTHWRFSTSGNIAVVSTPTLEGPWKYRGALVTNGTRIYIDYKQDIWAPAATKINGNFYCHYTVSYGIQDLHNQRSNVKVPGTAESNCLTENGGTTILASHGDIYVPDGQDIMVHPESRRTVMSYHYIRLRVSYDNEKKFFGFNYLDWDDGWPVVVPADQ